MFDKERRHMTDSRGMLIGGKERAALSGKTVAVLNPATGQPLADVAAGDAADVDLAVTAAREAFENGPWPRLPNHERATVLLRFADLIEENLERLFQLETLNNGRPVIETRAQLSRLPEWYRYNVALLLAPTLPFTSLGVADHLSEGQHAVALRQVVLS
jgi:acyl-CoA reductase-like NAD-dependent aldehyde dehydrogenase